MNIVLKEISPTDVDKIVKWKSDPELSKQIMSQFSIISREDALTWIATNSSDSNQRLRGIYHEDKDNNELLGVSRLMFIDFEAKKAEFGIYIGDRKYQGRGVGSKALQETIDLAFTSLKLQKIFLQVSSTNKAAIKLYKKFNFITEGVLKKHHFSDGVYQDIIYMALFNDVK